MLSPDVQVIVTASYDTTVRVFDSLAGAMLLCIENQHKCRFTSLHWNTRHQELVVGDDLGYVYFWNVTTEKCFKCERLCGPDTPAAGSAKGGAGSCAITSLKIA